MPTPAKTHSAPLDPATWLAGVDPSRQDEARRLLDLFGKVTGFAPRLWGPSIAGFGRYAYRYDSGHAGESLATGFSPRKAEISVYILPGYAGFGPILARLGPHRIGKSCLYLRHLDRIDPDALADLIGAGLADLGTRWTIHPQ
ncbi:MAG: DUF1801 domain-containing protein [Fuscovulum sp.]|jgi:hypothetical protein|nr:DUF1801 domain-containing protein [Fuscovulum sp.]